MSGLLASSPLLLGYLGPGGALGAVGSFLALLGAVLLALLGFVWLPLKRMLRNRKQAAEAAGDSEAASATVPEGGVPESGLQETGARD